MLNKKTDGKEEGVHKFLRADLEALRDLAKEIERKAREAGKMTGESCTQGAETTHDNFPFEQATRDLEMWTRRLAELRPALQDARVVADPDPSSDVVAIGMTVEFIDDYDKGSGVQRVRIGSF
ncbi:MAG: hypothetical protein HYZ08_00875, partial [Candidatus Kerfeldbacteria bacterium]|nr:hypothetical protein [Candidatus Kerfeldbacteria bacterium]